MQQSCSSHTQFRDDVADSMRCFLLTVISCFYTSILQKDKCGVLAETVIRLFIKELSYSGIKALAHIQL